MKAGFWLPRGSRLVGMAAFVLGGLMAAGSLIAGTAANAGSTKELAGTLPTLTTTNAVHSLSSKEAARAFPVHLRAVVTFFDPMASANRTGLFVHDSTGSIFVELPQGVFESLPAGSLVDLRGVSGAGEFAPIVAQPEIKVIGYQGLPADADRPSLARLLSGAEDGHWVEVEGVVHSLVENDRHISLQLTMSDGTTSILITKEAGVNYSRLVDAKVRIRGNASPLFDRRRRQMIGVHIQCPNLSAVEVLEPGARRPIQTARHAHRQVVAVGCGSLAGPPGARARTGHAAMARLVGVHTGCHARDLRADKPNDSFAQRRDCGHCRVRQGRRKRADTH